MQLRSRPSRGAVGCALLCLAGCASAPTTPSRGPEAAPLRPDGIFAPLQSDGAAELVALEQGEPTAIGTLRRAWILVQRRRGDEALLVVNRLIYGIPPPPPALVAYGHYVRAAAYRLLGDPERARFDFDEARRLAIDDALAQRIAADAPARVPAPAAARRIAAGRLSRTRWNARAVDRGNLDRMGRIWRVTIHHSAMLTRVGSPSTAAVAIRAIQQQHMDGRGYGDIGYHYLIDPDGRVWEGRSLAYQGAHASGANNEGNVGICLLGNFVRGADGQQPSDAQLRALQALLHDVCDAHDVPPSRILTHRELRPTSCPGEYLQHVVDGMRQRWAAAAAQPEPVASR
jgi:hypothetical protein